MQYQQQEQNSVSRFPAESFIHTHMTYILLATLDVPFSELDKPVYLYLIQH